MTVGATVGTVTVGAAAGGGAAVAAGGVTVGTTGGGVTGLLHRRGCRSGWLDLLCMARNGQQQGGGDKRGERAAGCGFVFHDADSMKGTRNRTRPHTGIGRAVAPRR